MPKNCVNPDFFPQDPYHYLASTEWGARRYEDFIVASTVGNVGRKMFEDDKRAAAGKYSCRPRQDYFYEFVADYLYMTDRNEWEHLRAALFMSGFNEEPNQKELIAFMKMTSRLSTSELLESIQKRAYERIVAEYKKQYGENWNTIGIKSDVHSPGTAPAGES